MWSWSLCYVIAILSGPNFFLIKIMYISYVIMEEMVAKGGLKQRAKETAGEKDWSRKPKKETDVSDAETKKGKEGLSEIVCCYQS